MIPSKFGTDSFYDDLKEVGFSDELGDLFKQADEIAKRSAETIRKTDEMRGIKPENPGIQDVPRKTPIANPENLQNAANAVNAVVKFKRDSQELKDLQQQIKDEIQGLTDLGRQASTEEAVRDFEDARDGKGRLIDSFKEFEELQEKISQDYRNNDISALNNALGNEAYRTDLKVKQLEKRQWESYNKRLVRMPKGTSVNQYFSALERIRSGDSEAIQQFTVPWQQAKTTLSEFRLWDLGQNWKEMLKDEPPPPPKPKRNRRKKP